MIMVDRTSSALRPTGLHVSLILLFLDLAFHFSPTLTYAYLIASAGDSFAAFLAG